MLPILERLIYKPKEAPVTRVLILVPTRELAVQVHTVGKQLANYTNIQITLAAGMCLKLKYCICVLGLIYVMIMDYGVNMNIISVCSNLVTYQFLAVFEFETGYMYFHIDTIQSKFVKKKLRQTSHSVCI